MISWELKFAWNWNLLPFCCLLDLFFFFFSKLNRTCCLALQIKFIFSLEITNMSETCRILALFNHPASVFLFLQWRMDIKVKILSWSKNHRDTWGYLTSSLAYNQSSFQEKLTWVPWNSVLDHWLQQGMLFFVIHN